MNSHGDSRKDSYSTPLKLLEKGLLYKVELQIEGVVRVRQGKKIKHKLMKRKKNPWKPIKTRLSEIIDKVSL